MRFIVAIFIIIPILEMWLLIKVGSALGALSTVALVFLTAVIGVALLKQQSLVTVARAQEKLQKGSIPAKQMAEGIFLAIGGALLLTPGFFTDTIGFACLIPGIRQIILGWGLSLMKKNMMSNHFSAFNTSRSQPFSSQDDRQSTHGRMNNDESGSSTIIEGEYRKEE